MAKKKKHESIFIPNQRDKNPKRAWTHWSPNDEDEKQKRKSYERMKKNALKSKR